MNIFISYSRMDLPFARVMHRDLVLAGLKPWLDVIDMPSNADWTEQTKDAIDTCDVYLLIVSPWAFRSEAVCGEWARARENAKITLLLVLQGVEADDVLQALGHTEMAIHGKAAQELLNILSWIDIRSHPERAVDGFMAWRNDNSLCQHGNMPSPIHPALMLFDNIPNSARISGLVYIGFGIAGILLLIVYSIHVMNHHMSSSIFSLATTRITDRFIPFYVMFFKKLTVMTSFLFMVWLGLSYPECVINGLKLFRRNSNLPYKMIPIFTAYFQGAICLAVSINTKYTSMFSMSSILPVGIASILLATFMLFAVRRIKLSPILNMWLPAENRREPKHRMGNMLFDPIRTNHPLFIPIKSDTQIHRVFLLYARPDAGFIKPLIKYLELRAITSETSYNLITSCQALIIVLSPWLNESAMLEEIWKLALDALMPIIPVLLQDAELPLGIRHLNWLDARSNPARAYEDIAAVLKGNACPASYHVPYQSAKLTGLTSVVIIGLLVTLSSGMKILLSGAVFPFTLWFYPNFVPSYWVAAGVLLVLGYIQYLSISIYIYRKVSYYAIIMLQLTVMISGWICSYHLSTVTSSLAVLSPFHILVVDCLGLACIVCAPNIRKWTPSGLHLRIRPFSSGKRETRMFSNIAALTLSVMVVLIPGICASREIVHKRGSVLIIGQPILGRFEKYEESHRWYISSQRGDSGTIIAEGISRGFAPTISLYNAQGKELTSGEKAEFQQTIIKYHMSSEEPYYINIRPLDSRKGVDKVYRLTAIKNGKS